MLRTVESERLRLNWVAQQVARICQTHGMQFVGAVGSLLADGETFAVVATHHAQSAVAAAMLAHSVVPITEQSLAQAQQAASAEVDYGPLN